MKAGAALVLGFAALAGAGDAQAPIPPAPTARDAFLPTFARSYYPGRSGQIMIVPREGHFVTQPADAFMHGSPWAYDARVPLILFGPRHVKPGRYGTPARHQDIAPTVLALLGHGPGPRMTGAPLRAALAPGASPPKAVLVVVLDAFRADYLDRLALPTLSRLAREGAAFEHARVDYLPTATGVAHATISTGSDPGVHGIVVNNLFDAASGKAVDAFADGTSKNLMAPSLADLWVDATAGKAIVATQAGYFYAAGALAGHGACRPKGKAVFASAYDRKTGRWETGSASCFRLPPSLAGRTPQALWEGASGKWRGHDIGNPDAVRRSALFADYEADSLIAVLEAEPIGADGVTDLLLVNFKTTDFVSHQYGPDAPETADAAVAADAALGRLVQALEAKTGGDAVVIVTADHGMPSLADASKRHFAADVVELLNARFDPEARRLVRNYEPSNAQLYVDGERLRALGISLADVARHLESLPFVFAAYTEDEVRRAAKR